MIFTLEETHENILQKYSKTCSKNRKIFFIEIMCKDKY